MAGAAYECTATLTDDESFGFTLELKNPDGSGPAWADYTFEYELTGCGHRFRSTTQTASL
jgi:hypothetical protein